MKIFLSLILTGLLFASFGIVAAQTDQNQGTTTEETTTGTTTTSHQTSTHMKSDECTAAKVRTKLMDNGIQTKSSKSLSTTTGTTSPMELIEVDVANGVVTLNGTVPTAADTQRILTIVRGTDGVTRVVSNLKPGSTGGADMTPGEVGTSSDSTKTTTGTTSSTYSGTGSTLSGTTERKTSTTTKSTTKTTESPSDAAVTAAVKDKLSMEASTVPPVDVATEDGVVTLTGTVANQGEAERLIMLVRAIPNVKSVNSRLKVQQ